MAYSADPKPKDKPSLHKQIMARADEASMGDFDNRTAMIDDLRFYSNENGNGQWDPEVYRERLEQGRPIVTVPLMGQFVRQVTNEARNNRPAIKVRPVDDDADPETAEILEGIVRHIEDQSEAVSKAYIPAIANAAICGIGWFRIKTKSTDDDPWEQDIFIEGIPNALGVLCDPFAKDPTRMDARYMFVIDDMSREDFEAKYPDAACNDFAVTNNAAAMVWWNTDTVRVAEYWCKEDVTRTLARTKDGKILDITNVPKDALKFLPANEIRKVKTHKICQYIVSGSEILEGPVEWPGHYIPIIPVIGEETNVGENRVRSGLVRHAKDPQRLYNLWRSNQAEIIGLQPKSPYVATFKQIEKYKDIWAQANRRALPYLPYDADPQSPGAPKREQPPVASPAMAEEIAIAAGELRSTTGIYDAGLGQHSSEAVSGRAIGKLQQQSDMATMHFGDNLQLSIRHCGRVAVDIIPVYYDTERTVRLLNEDGTNTFEKINQQIMTQDGVQPLHDLSVGKYDVTITTGPSYATRRMENVDMLMQLIQTAPESAQFMLDIIVKNMDGQGMDEAAKRLRTVLLKAHPEFADPKDEEQPPPPSPADQHNAFMAKQAAEQEAANTRLANAQADVAEMEATEKAVEIDAVTKTHHMQVESVILKELMDVVSRGQAALAPAQPGQGTPPQPQPQNASA